MWYFQNSKWKENKLCLNFTELNQKYKYVCTVQNLKAQHCKIYSSIQLDIKISTVNLVTSCEFNKMYVLSLYSPFLLSMPLQVTKSPMLIWCPLRLSNHPDLSTVFPRIVSSETILFWKQKMWKFSYSFRIMANFYFINWIVAAETI